MRPDRGRPSDDTEVRNQCFCTSKEAPVRRATLSVATTLGEMRQTALVDQRRKKALVSSSSSPTRLTVDRSHRYSFGGCRSSLRHEPLLTHHPLP